MLLILYAEPLNKPVWKRGRGFLLVGSSCSQMKLDWPPIRLGKVFNGTC